MFDNAGTITVVEENSSTLMSKFEFDDSNIIEYELVDSGFDFYNEIILYGSVNKSVSVYPNVTANFSSDTVGCSPKEIIFYNTSSGSSGFIWDFGDSTILTETNSTHIYENNGYYNIILIAKNELCSDTSNRTISVTNNSKGNIIIHLLQTHIILTMEIFIKIMG